MTKPAEPRGQRLANPNDPATKRALAITCPNCGARPGQRCKALHHRIVHYARVEFRPNPPGSKTGTERP